MDKTMELTQLRNIVEGALLAAGQPLSLNRLKSLFDEAEEPEVEVLKQVLEQIAADCEGRGIELKEVGSGYRLQTRDEIAPWINRLWEEKPQKYSRALLETLALVAYRQPITRGDIEEVRGVAVSSHIIKTLTEREWIKVVGQRDVPGRPSLYATTRQFLDYFNIRSLDELPSLGEIRDLDDINKALDLNQDQTQEQDQSGSQELDQDQEPDQDQDQEQNQNQEQSRQQDRADDRGETEGWQITDGEAADRSEALSHTTDPESPDTGFEAFEDTTDPASSLDSTAH